MEEVIKIQSSYKIIKNYNVANTEEFSPINTEIDYIEEKTSYDEDTGDNVEKTIDVEKLKDQIRRELLLELENDRLKIIEETKAQAMEDAKAIKEAAKEEGHAFGVKNGQIQGYTQGVEDAQVEANEIKSNAISLLKQAEVQVAEYYRENKKNIIKLATDIAESIVHHTIDTSDDGISSLIMPILHECEKEESIIITCHPDNSVYIKENLQQFRETCSEARFIILEDNNLERNGCTIESEFQIIDLQVRKQIDKIMKEIKDLG